MKCLVACLFLLTACATAATRSDVITAWREVLVKSGLTEPDARCITDRFFAPMTDREVGAFQRRDELTPSEFDLWSQIARECA